jgi:hypothetical protein
MGHDVEVHRHPPIGQQRFHRQVAGKAVGLMVLKGMEERLARIQRHLPAFQQGNYPIDAGKRGKFAVAGDSRDTGAPVKIARCGRETTNLTRFTRTIAPEADRHLTDIKELHHHS